jgi:SAM-dependent methyltransferase
VAAPPDDANPRARARTLAAAAIADGAPLRWFEELYAEGARGDAIVPWADRVANPLMTRALAADTLAGTRALVIGCGLGDDAAWLAERGATVTAFDLSPTAVGQARDRFPDAPIAWEVADLLALPPAWRGAFDLVVEIFTLQCLPPGLRERGLAAAAGALAPGGLLLALARAREPEEPTGNMPWPLVRAELAGVDAFDCTVESLVDVWDDETPPVRRWVMRARKKKSMW